MTYLISQVHKYYQIVRLSVEINPHGIHDLVHGQGVTMPGRRRKLGPAKFGTCFLVDPLIQLNGLL